MSIPRSLKEALYNTIHRNKKSINEIAEECSCSASVLYRYCADEDTTSYADFPLRRLIPLLNATNDDSILDYLEARRGRIAFRIPKVAIKKMDEGVIVEEYQKATIEAVAALRKFLSEPNKKNFDIVEDALINCMKSTASCKKYCDKKMSGQLEMNL
ncbi:phage regulatory CII family protein [Melioribacter sp. Ez-97]|uniref:phage regulatory CII family protein n=1 Tax=unclassified Melioribacter TaxID=2627329 RepID=UPI003ED8FB31